jgi:hypothetical protein
MQSVKLISMLLGSGALPALTLAGVIDPNLQDSGYGDRAVLRGVAPGDSATMCLVMMDSQGHVQAVNSTAECDVTRGNTFTDLGSNSNGGGDLLGAWEEVVQGNSLYVNAVFKTSDGSQFMPITSKVNGQSAYFWSWHMGLNDPVNFQNFVTAVPLITGRVAFSSDGGQTFTNTSSITTNLSSDWDPGRDPGVLMTNIGDGTNYMLLQYQIQVVPTPAALATLGLGGLFMGRRRR